MRGFVFANLLLLGVLAKGSDIYVVDDKGIYDDKGSNIAMSGEVHANVTIYSWTKAQETLFNNITVIHGTLKFESTGPNGTLPEFRQLREIGKSSYLS